MKAPLLTTASLFLFTTSACDRDPASSPPVDVDAQDASADVASPDAVAEDVATDTTDPADATDTAGSTDTADTTDTAPCEAQPAHSESRTVMGALGSLGGTLEVPAGCGPFPVVLLVSGSGTTDRDGNNFDRPDNYRLVALGLRDQGIASLRYDDPGIGESLSAAPDRLEDYRYEHDVEPAARWAETLLADDAFGAVVVAGHSQGALTATLVAEREPIDGLVTLAGTSLPAGALLIQQLRDSATPEELEALEAAVAELNAGRLVTTPLPPRVANVLARPLQPYLISWFAFDPVDELARTTVPLLVVHGRNDWLVSPVQARELAAARPGVRATYIDRMAHSLKEAGLDAASQRAAKTDPEVPLAPGLIDTLTAFVLGL
jgi:hypothetical protein